MPREIELTNGGAALVDDEDYASVAWRSWTRHSAGYAISHQLYMHRFIMNPPDRLEVHHIDGNGLNNCRSNLKVVTHSYNRRAGTPWSSDTRYLYHNPAGKWEVRVKVGRLNLYFGCYKELEIAKAVRDSILEDLLEKEEENAKRDQSG